jgi:regulatory protein
MVEEIVTAVEPQRHRRGRRVNVFVDGRYAFSLARELAGLLRVGQPLSGPKTAELLQEDEQARAYEAALAFLSYRPRSEREIRDRLKKKDVSEPVIELVLERLRDLRLVDDQEFARYWVEQRQTHRPRGARLLRQELHQKGIARETTAEALQQSDGVIDPIEAACRAGRLKARSLGSLDERSFDQKLGQFLLRRGFDFETARNACRRLHQAESSDNARLEP